MAEGEDRHEHGDGQGSDAEDAGHASTDASRDDADGGKEPDEDHKPSPLANPKVRIALIVGGVLAAILLVYWLVHHCSYGRYQQSTNDAYLNADQINISSRVAGYVRGGSSTITRWCARIRSWSSSIGVRLRHRRPIARADRGGER